MREGRIIRRFAEIQHQHSWTYGSIHVSATWCHMSDNFGTGALICLSALHMCKINHCASCGQESILPYCSSDALTLDGSSALAPLLCRGKTADKLDTTETSTRFEALKVPTLVGLQVDSVAAMGATAFKMPELI